MLTKVYLDEALISRVNNTMPIGVAPRKDDNEVNISTINAQKVETFNRVRTELDKVFHEQELKRKASELGIEFVDLFGKPIDVADVTMMPKQDAIDYNIGLWHKEKNLLYFATADYNPDKQSVIFDRYKAEGYDIKVSFCTEDSFNKIIKTYDYAVSRIDNSKGLEINPQRLEELMAQDLSSSKVKQLLETSATQSISDIVEILLVSAYQQKVSDIHVEPEKDDCTLRMRVDGVLQEFARFDREVQRKFESRIKILAHLKLNIDNVPQDGRFSFIVKGVTVDVRTSLLPSNYGYSIVMRLLGVGNVTLALPSLGFAGSQLSRIMDNLERNQGLILTTGPTGSGKTTTLYTLLKSLNTGESKIITLEDPVEYKLEGISQTQIDAEAGFTFGSGLRSILRQDPDIVMVGEIRDEETAKTAIDAALTGHKVLSTLHTNDAVGALPRLMEMQIKGFALADAIAVIIGQRLIRTLCPHCKKPYTLAMDEQMLVDSSMSNLPKDNGLNAPATPTWFEAVGCDKCGGSGYKGRIGAYEVMTITDGLRKLLINEVPSFSDLRKVSAEEGMVTMMQDAIIKAMKGYTDLDEIKRVIL
jgi:type IV pilus assembly protein PilB